jgi:hypothetical protein
MSYTLVQSVAATPQATKVLSGALAGVLCRENPDGFGEVPWPRAIVHLYRPGKSTRGVEVVFDGAELQTRLVSLASPEDWQLAYALHAAFAAGPDVEVRGEDGTKSRVDGLAGAFADVAARETAAGVVAMETSLQQNPGSQIGMSGPVRQMTIGHRVINDLPAEPGKRVFALLDRIRRIQYIESEGYEVKTAVPLKAPGIPTFSVWTPAKKQAFEDVEALGLSSPKGNLYVPVAALPGLLGDKFQWLDEVSFAIDAVDDPTLVERAAAESIDIWKSANKKWWQFWK